MGVGILGGYNWALGSKAILGIEAGYNYYRKADDYKDLLDCSGAECQFKSDVKQSVSAVGRVGYLVTNNTLLYGLFGYSGAQIKRSLNVIIEGTDSETNKKWQDGWVAGAGVEYLASKNVSVKLEYRYSDLGHSAYNLSGFQGIREKFDYTQDQVLLGVNYRF
ncbi:porin family protein [Acinetobacter sp. ANC 4633]|nr:porin family protein [Acinetobacter sp. ANC 4633]